MKLEVFRSVTFLILSQTVGRASVLLPWDIACSVLDEVPIPMLTLLRFSDGLELFVQGW